MTPGSNQTFATATYSLGTSNYAVTPADRPAPLLDIELDSLQGHINQTADLCNRAQRLADRMFGAVSTPIKQGQDAKNPEVIPVTIQLRQKQEVLTVLLTQLHDQLQRLETL